MFKNVPFEYRPSVKPTDKVVESKIRTIEKQIKNGKRALSVQKELSELRDKFSRGTRFIVSESLMVRFLEIERLAREN